MEHAAPVPEVVRRRARRRRRPGVVVLVLAVALTGGAMAYEGSGGDLQALVRPRAYVEIDGEAVAVPAPAPAQGRPLPAVAVTTSGSHAFLHTDAAGGPVGYDPCRPVRYVVRPDGAPAGGQAVLDEAVVLVQAATGLRLEAAGTTDEEPRLERRLIQPERYGSGWAPVLVAWSDETVVPELAGQVAGVGGSAAVPGADGTGRWLAAGRLVLDADDLSELLARDGGAAQARAIVVHELAHVLGLDHVDDPAELMHPMTSTRTDLGPGDLQGLALLGQVACEE
ncbi:MULTISPECIES: matrixin family metalloprotease [unclassified Actinotalea]|uniref:matrixin family metalloprotease n=1 Tax=unclassified Actinotalea TaxID=2638618 RepID=UPI0015F45082|nr:MULTISPECIES: matrixin family metalloprotease [unclassified Actinotalea]